MDKQPLRIGIMLNSFRIKAWQYKVIKDLYSMDYVKICGLIKNESSTKPSKWPLLFFLTYKYFDKKFFPVKYDPFEIKDLSPLLPSEIETILVTPKEGKYTDRFLRKDVEKIKSQNFDVIIRLGFRILKGEILNSAIHGIWSLHHGHNEVNRGSPPGFWELFQKIPVTGSILQILNEDLDNGITIYNSFSATDKISLNRNIAPLYWKSSSFFGRKLKELYQTGQIVPTNKSHQLNLYSNVLYRPPRNLKFLRMIPAFTLGVVIHQLKKLFFKQQWGLYYQFSKTIGTSMWRFKKLNPPRNRMWADPFIVFYNNKHFVFIEELEYKSKKGFISCFELTKDQQLIEPKKIIEEDYHLSYPFIFKVEEKYYLIPESKENNSIDLYECTAFPFQWKKTITLMKNISAVDTTLFYYDNLWWMFTTISEHPGISSKDETFLFYADNLVTTKWIPHPKNPIISDVRKARQAGRVFKHNNKYYRLGQDCSRNYGYGISFNEILILNREDYQEQTVDTIEPDWDKSLEGTHTFDYCAGLTIVDGFWKISRFF